MKNAKFNTVLSLIVFSVLLSISGCGAVLSPSSGKLVDGFVVVDDVKLARADIESAGGVVNHIFPAEKVLIGKIPSNLKSSHVSGIYFENSKKVPKGSAKGIYDMWAGNLAEKRIPVEERIANIPEGLEPPFYDVILQDPPELESLKQYVTKDLNSLPEGAALTDTSLYMIGDIGVGIITPESGSSSPNTEDWTEGELSQVYGKIYSGLEWWNNLSGNKLTFVYQIEDPIIISREPILEIHSFMWAYTIPQLMYSLGYGTGGVGDKTGIYDYINDLRLGNINGIETDWGMIYYVVDSSNDQDGKFLDNWFAFTVSSNAKDNAGIYTIMTYDNNGYGIDRMDIVSAHELGHIFGADDQYTNSDYNCTCEGAPYLGGYLDYPNGNCDLGCSINESSIMKDLINAYLNSDLDYYARGQIGWQDSDGDGIFDIIDFEPDMTLTDAWIDNLSYFYGGNGFADLGMLPAVNPNYNSVSINKIFSVQHRIIGLDNNTIGSWFDASPLDGLFDTSHEDYNFSSNESLGWGNYKIQTMGESRFGVTTSEANYASSDVLMVAGCTDSDGGLNFSVFGVVNNFNGVFGNAQDNCENTMYLREYYCNGTNIDSQLQRCTYGCNVDEDICRPRPHKRTNYIPMQVPIEGDNL